MQKKTSIVETEAPADFSELFAEQAEYYRNEDRSYHELILGSPVKWDNINIAPPPIVFPRKPSGEFAR